MSRRKIQVVGAMLERDGGRYLITQRRPGASLPLLWEFPGGRVEPGESPEAALARELLEEMGIRVHVEDQVIHTQHEYPGYDIDFQVFRCQLVPKEQEIRHLGALRVGLVGDQVPVADLAAVRPGDVEPVLAVPAPPQ